MPSTRLLPLLALAGLLVAGCGGGDSDSPEHVASTHVVERVNGNYAQGTYVFRNQAEMAAAWAPLTQFGQTASHLPSYEFGTTMIVGVSLGTGRTCCFPTITQVVRAGNTLTVSWRGDGPLGLATIDYPRNDFVSVPMHAGPVEFVRIDR